SQKYSRRAASPRMCSATSGCTPSPRHAVIDLSIRAGLFLTSPRLRGERLSFWSSEFWLPWGFVSQDCVEDGEQLSGNSDDGDQLVFAGGDEPVAEQLEGRVVTSCDHGAHEQR